LPLTDEERRKFMDGVEKHEINFVYQSHGSHLQNSLLKNSWDSDLSGMVIMRLLHTIMPRPCLISAARR